MKFFWYRVGRLLHPVTLAVILVGIAGFLIGLIVAVERQDAAIVSPRINAEASSRIARLETALAERETEFTELQAELAKQRADMASAPLPTALVEAESRVTGVEAVLADSRAELKALRNELDVLSGQLAEAIQSRDDLRKDSEQSVLERDSFRQELEQARQDRDAQREEREQATRDNENERDSLEHTIAGLRGELEAAQESARASQSAEAAREESSTTDAAAVETPPAAAELPATASSPSVRAAQTESEDTKPAPQLGPIARGVVAYRAADYAKAYALWLPPALKGATRAQFFIGALYFEGRGVPADRVMSYMWLRAATKRDDPGAIKLLDKLRAGMSGPELADAETRIANGETIPLR